MRYSEIIAASLVAPLVAAHGIEGAPSVFGLPKHLRASNPLAGFQARQAAHPVQAMGPRQAAGPERCGPENGNQICGGNDCCSPAGYCGTTREHCQAPDCLFNYGPGCDANKTPRGASTLNDPRPQLGSIPYGGAGIYACSNPGTVAITYDDGPYVYTQGVMEQFEARGWHATFFLTGNNIGKGAIDENWAGVIQRMYDNGHQVASHTWSHQDLSAITKEQIYDQMVKNEMAIRNILGKYPTYMRPPYSSCGADCEDVMRDLGYVVSYFDLDTSDYLNLTPELIQNAKDKFKTGIDTRNVGNAGGDRLVIGHDIHQLTAQNLTVYMLEYMEANGLRGVTMGECLNDPKANWYRDSTPAGPAPPSSSSGSTSASATASVTASSATGPVPTPTGPSTTDGSCGASNGGMTCIGFVGPDGLSECCSQYGYCGNSELYCAAGCQAGFGKCGAQDISSSSAVVSASSSNAASSAVVSVSSSVAGSSAVDASSTISSAPSAIPTTSGEMTRDGTCGGQAGFTCVGFTLDGEKAECCSEWGWCGNSADHCDNCNPIYGNCPGSVSSSAVLSSSLVVVSSDKPEATSSNVESLSVSSVVVSSDKPEATSVVLSSDKPEVTSVAISSGKPEATTVVSSGKPEATSDVVSSGKPEATTDVVSSGKPEATVSVSTLSETAPAATFTAEYPASTFVPAVSKGDHPTGSAPAEYSVSTPGASEVAHSSSVDVEYSASTFVPAVSKGDHPTGSAPAEYPVSTPVASEVVSSSSADVEYPVESVPSMEQTTGYPVSSPVPTPAYPVSSFSTAVKPSSTSCSTSDVVPTPTALPVSEHGRCGPQHGGQTCAGYKTSWGLSLGCCCKQTGRCSKDPWACTRGCDPKHGKCWY